MSQSTKKKMAPIAPSSAETVYANRNTNESDAFVFYSNSFPNEVNLTTNNDGNNQVSSNTATMSDVIPSVQVISNSENTNTSDTHNVAPTNQSVVTPSQAVPFENTTSDTRPGSSATNIATPRAHSVLIGSGNATSTNLQRMIAKSRGDASSVIPPGFGQDSNRNQAVESTQVDTATPGAYPMAGSSGNAVSSNLNRLIAKSRGDASSVIPPGFGQNSNSNQNLEIPRADTATSEVRSVSSSGNVISSNLQRLIHKSQGGAVSAAIPPVRLGQDSNSNQSVESTHIDTVAPGAYFVTIDSSAAASSTEQRFLGEDSAATSLASPADGCVPDTVAAVDGNEQPISLVVRRMIAKQRGDMDSLALLQAGHEIDTGESLNFSNLPSSSHLTTNVSVGNGVGILPFVNSNEEALPYRDTPNENVVSRSTNSCMVEKYVSDGILDQYEKSGIYGVSPRDNLECGVYSSSNDEGLVCAVAVEGDCEMYLPGAIEFDADTKQLRLHNGRFKMYIFFILTIATTIGIVAVVLVSIRTEKEVQQKVPYRATIGIRENIERVVMIAELDDTTSPYRKALDWIMFTDSMAMTPENPKFFQRFILTYFYFATSEVQPWNADCAPLANTKSDDCKVKYWVVEGLRYVDGIRWLSNIDECDWIGAYCDTLGQVIKLDVNGLVKNAGSFPKGITLLPYLHDLSLYSTGMKGPLPIELWNSKILSKFAAPHNELSGTFPAELYRSRSLHVLELNDNDITGQLTNNTSFLHDIKIFDVGMNNITRSLPNEIGELISMSRFTLKENMISGTIPTAIGNLSNLLLLDISGNTLTGTIPDVFSGYQRDAALFFGDNFLVGTIPDSFYESAGLVLIDLSNNIIEGTISSKISKADNLMFFLVRNNDLTGSLPERYGKSSLTNVELQGNMLNGTVPPGLCSLVQSGQIEHLTLDCREAGINDIEEPEIFCPRGCCTMCCNQDGELCEEIPR